MKHRFKFIQRSSTSRSEERGAVLILVEMLAVVFIVIAGLAIDSALLATSKSQRRHTAEYIAFQALHTFIQTAGGFNTKLEAARQRAEAIAGVNVYIGKGFSADPSLGDIVSADGGVTPPAKNGTIYPGIWHREPPASCVAIPVTSATNPPCPCDGAGNWTGPCFQANVDFAAAPGLEPNAFKVDLSLPSTSPFKTVLSKVNGDKSYLVSVEATATIVPRHGIFLVDLSRSSHNETHLALESTSSTVLPIVGLSKLSESAFEIDRSCAPAHGNPCLVTDTCSISGGKYPGSDNNMSPIVPPVYTGIYDWIWDNDSAGLRYLQRPGGPVAVRPTRLAAAQPAYKHYRSDYACYEPTFVEDGGAPKTKDYVVDRWIGVTDTGALYDGPEPLTTMVDGLHEALTTVENQKIPGDLYGVIGFDRSADIDLRTLPLSAPSSNPATAFKQFTDAMDVSAPMDSAQQIARFEQYMFFIRPEGKANIPEALRRAKNMLQAAPDASTVNNFVVLMSDGIGNCATGVCGDEENDYIASTAETENILFNEYLPNEIALHMIHVGMAVRPHTLLQRSHSSTRCMTESELRSANPPELLVDSTGGDTFNDALTDDPRTSSPGKFFMDPSRLYRAVRDTGGIWAPLRDPCQKLGVNADIRSDLETACQSAAAGARVVLNPYTDASGRLICDPLGRARRQQIRDFIAEIVGGPPYVLVN